MKTSSNLALKNRLRSVIGVILAVGMVLAKSKGDTLDQTNTDRQPVKISPTIQISPSIATNGVSAHFNALDERVATLTTDDIKEFDSLSAPIQELLRRGLALTQLKLTYKYGSADPANGGMDCSGTVYYLLGQAGLKNVPRDASELYRWVWQSGAFNAVVSSHSDSFEFANLKPGDLLFWIGTYQIDRDPPVTHVMIYLGTDRQTGRRVMIGASEGRRFGGISRSGVSVFDLELPRASATAGNLESRFIGYGSIPGWKSPPEDTSASTKKNL